MLVSGTMIVRGTCQQRDEKINGTQHFLIRFIRGRQAKIERDLQAYFKRKNEEWKKRQKENAFY